MKQTLHSSNDTNQREETAAAAQRCTKDPPNTQHSVGEIELLLVSLLPKSHAMLGGSE
jgi:hypothetical protein